MRHIWRFLLLFYIGICFTGILHAQEGMPQIHDISLESLLNTKINTAAKYEQTISEAPASVTIITSEDIERYGYHTLEDLFKGVRGFYISNDQNYTYLGARGFSRPTDYNNRILLLIDGHSINENIYETAFIGTELGLPLSLIDRIEIVRGPGSALYGADAMFAVVNIITKRGNTIDGIKLAVEGGSYGRRISSVAFGRQFDNGVDISFSGQWADINGQDFYFQEYDAPQTNHGIAENLDWDKYYGGLTTLTYKDWTLQGIIASRKTGIPTGAFGIAFNADAAETRDERSYIELKYDHKLRVDKNLMLRGYFDHFGYRGTYPYDIEDDAADFFEASDGNWMGGEFQFRWDVRADNRLTVGAEYRNHLRADYRARDGEEITFDENFPYDVFSLYFQDAYQITKDLSLTLGIRRDRYSTVGSTTTPRGGIIYNPFKSVALKLLYGEAFRAPNIYEVYYESEGDAKGNPELKPEKIRTAEIVWEQRLSDALFGTVSFYNYEMMNLIDQMIDPSDELLQFKNVSKVQASGVELELNARLKMGLRGYANYIFQNAKDADSKKKLTNSPSHLMKIGLTYPVMEHFYVATELQYETERITLIRQIKTEPYLLANLNVSTEPLFNHFTFSLRVNNLFNVTYKTPGGFEHIQPIALENLAAIPQNGRNFALRLAYEF